MGLGDSEDLIPGILAIIAALGFIGGIATFIPFINSIPVINFICPLVHSGFVAVSNFINQYISLGPTIIALLLEIITIIISILIIVKIGY